MTVAMPKVKVRKHGPPNELKFSVTFTWDEDDPTGAQKAGACIGKMLGAVLTPEQADRVVRELALQRPRGSTRKAR